LLKSSKRISDFCYLYLDVNLCKRAFYPVYQNLNGFGVLASFMYNYIGAKPRRKRRSTVRTSCAFFYAKIKL